MSSRVDCLVICPLGKELRPTLVAFGIDPFAREDDNIEGHKVFFVDWKREDGLSVSLAISAVHEARNVPCADATFKLVSVYDPEAVFLVGIGGGVKTKVKLGDVVVSSGVIDASGGRAEVGGVKRRDERLTPPYPISRQIDNLGTERVRHQTWDVELRNLIERVRDPNRFVLPDSADVGAAPFKIDRGIIVVGEQLIADGSLPAHLENRDERIRSCDMEGTGFAHTCIDRSRQWLIFRGISDYGDPDKTDKWQSVAALAAASALGLFLRTEFRLRSEMRSAF